MGTVRAAADIVCIVVVLTIVFPEADRAYIEAPALIDRLVVAAWAAERQVFRLGIEAVGVGVEPRGSGTGVPGRSVAFRL